MSTSDATSSSIEWNGQLQFEERAGGKRLTVVMTAFCKRQSGTRRWAGLALEAPAEADSLGEILTNHRHADLGDFETIGECVAACEAYIDHWRTGGAREAACECAEITVEAAP